MFLSTEATQPFFGLANSLKSQNMRNASMLNTKAHNSLDGSRLPHVVILRPHLNATFLPLSWDTIYSFAPWHHLMHLMPLALNPSSHVPFSPTPMTLTFNPLTIYIKLNKNNAKVSSLKENVHLSFRGHITPTRA